MVVNCGCDWLGFAWILYMDEQFWIDSIADDGTMLRFSDGDYETVIGDCFAAEEGVMGCEIITGKTYGWINKWDSSKPDFQPLGGFMWDTTVSGSYVRFDYRYIQEQEY